MATVAVDQLCKQYAAAGERAVKNVCFSVADGEFMVLLGPSGCGKSTVLRMISGLEAITSGTVSIDGRVVNHVPAKSRDIAMVFQSYALYPHMSVYDNIAFGLRRRGFARDDIDARVKATATKLGLADFLTRKPHALSGGQRQRVALGRAIVRDPKVFLFDEPLSNLDASLRVTTRNELIRQQREIGTTSIYVTHDQVEAMTMGDRICIMNKGEVVQIGRPLEIYRNPVNTFVARFLGNPPMNLAPGRIEERNSHPAIVIAGAAITMPDALASALAQRRNSEILIGIRPEDLAETYLADPSHYAPLPARVITVEPLGAETLVTLTLQGTETEMIARVDRDCTLRAGDRFDIGLDVAALHIFDAVSTQALGTSGNGKRREGNRK